MLCVNEIKGKTFITRNTGTVNVAESEKRRCQKAASSSRDLLRDEASELHPAPSARLMLTLSPYKVAAATTACMLQ